MVAPPARSPSASAMRDEAETGGSTRPRASALSSSTNVWLKLSEPPLLRVDRRSRRRTSSRSSRRNCTLIDAANTDAPVTRATPISTGAAVRAVRFGLRCTLPRAIAPVTPRHRCTGAPSRRAIGRAITGPSSKTAANSKAMPTASRMPSAPTSTATIVPTPTAAQPIAAATRPRNRTGSFERSCQPSPPQAAPDRRRSPGRSRRAGWRPCRQRS